MSVQRIRVFIVDDQELIRTGFALILGSDPEIEIVGEAEHGLDALHKLAELSAEHRAPDVVLMDVRMPELNGIETTKRIMLQFAGVRVIVMTTFDLDEYAIDAVAAGASGFLLKDARAAELVAAVRSVASGEAVMSHTVTQRLIGRLREQSLPAPSIAQADLRLETLTEREREVFVLIAEGLSNAEIGARLFLSESTVKTHVGRVFTKLELRDRVHAVILAFELGMR